MLPSPRPRALAWALALCLPLAGSAGESDALLAARVAREVADYARDDVETGYMAAIADLAEDDAARRRAAGHYLALLVDAARAAEKTEIHPARQRLEDEPALGRCVALARLQAEIAAALAGVERGEEVLEPAAALLKEMPEDEDLFQVVAQRESRRADEMLREMLEAPEVHAALVPGAIDQALQRALPVEAAIRRLACSYRDDIRPAARDAAAQMRLRDLPAYTPAEAFTPSLDAMLREIAAMLPDALPAPARWVRVTAPARMEAPARAFSGWVLAQQGREYTILDYFGRRVLVVPGPFPENRRTPLVDEVIEHGAVQPRTFPEEAKLFAAVRADAQGLGENGDLLSPRKSRGLENRLANYITEPEALVAAWSYQRGDKATAAAILFPRLQEVNEPEFRGYVLTLLADRCHDRLLAALNRRDLPEALRLARHLAQPLFHDAEGWGRACELTDQLAARLEDFKGFRLPTADEWKKQQGTLDRAGQIRFLAERLRLLQGAWEAGVGDPKYTEPQFAEVWWEGGGRRRRTPVINPYQELRALDLGVSDLDVLIPFLADESFSLVSKLRLSRDLYSTALHRVNQIVARVIRFVAWRDLAQLETFDPLDPPTRAAHLARLQEWVSAHGAQSAEALLLETLRTTKDGLDFETAALEASRRQLSAAAPVLAGRTGEFDPSDTELIGELCSRLPGPEAMAVARGWIKGEDETLRFWGGLLLVRQGSEREKEHAAEVLRPFLEKDESPRRARLGQAFRSLLASQNEAVLRMAGQVALAQNQLDEEGNRLLLHLLRLGRQEIFAKLLERLADTHTPLPAEDGRGRVWTDRKFTPAVTTGMLLQGSIPNAPGEPFNKAREKRLIEMAKKWLRRQLALVQAGKAPEIAAQPPLEAESQLDETLLE